MKPLQRSSNLVFRYQGESPEALLPAGYTSVRLDHASVLELFGRATKRDWRARAYVRLLDEGASGIAAIHGDGRWAAVQWIAPPGVTGLTHLPPRITRPFFWCFNEHTQPEHRRLGLWRALKSRGLELARQQSGDDVALYSDTDHSNLASRRAHEMFGFERLGAIDAVTLRYWPERRLVMGRWNRRAEHPDIVERRPRSL